MNYYLYPKIALKRNESNIENTIFLSKSPRYDIA